MSTGELMNRRPIGQGPLAVTRVGLGCAPLGNLFAAVSDEAAADTVNSAWECGIRLFDTAPLYGSGLSERRLGDALRGRPRNDFVVSTKVGRRLVPVADADPTSIFVDAPRMRADFDFTRDGVLRSIESSLERLQLDRIDIVHVHDPDDHVDVAIAGAFPTLITLRDEGVIGAVGCGMNHTAPLQRFVAEVELDVILLAGRYSLLDSSGGDELLPACAERGISVIIGGVFNSGLLADPDANGTYDYAEAATETVQRARHFREVCEGFDVTLPAAAIGFALRHPAVTSVLVGARSRNEVVTDVTAAQAVIPDELWPALGLGVHR